MKTLAMSQREYKVAILDAGDMVIQHENLKTILDPKNDFEYIYAIQEEIDKLLDLKVGESMYIQPIRDNNDTKGIILRTA
jgi:spore coat polysaccharide biosynthesis protein SpsF (cytidylyltransferase family)